MYYYTTQKEKRLDGAIVATKYIVYKHIDDIPVQLLTDVKKGEVKYLYEFDVSKDSCKKRIASLVTTKKKILTKEEIDNVLKDISEDISVFFRDNKPAGYKINNNWFVGSRYDYKKIVEDMGFVMLKGKDCGVKSTWLKERDVFPIYINKEYALKRSESIKSKANVPEHQDKLKRILSTITKAMFVNRFGDIFNLSPFKHNMILETFVKAKKELRYTYPEITNIITKVVDKRNSYFRNGFHISEINPKHLSNEYKLYYQVIKKILK